MSSESATPRASALFSIAIVSASVLALEICTTRIFSAAMKYHFSFLVISLAICGLGMGGMAAYFLRDQQRWLRLSSAGLGLTATVSAIVYFRVILAAGIHSLPAISCTVLPPFFCAGIYIAIQLRAYPKHAGLMYGFDLIGSALSIPLVLLLMEWFNPVNAFLMIAALSSIPAVLMSRRRWWLAGAVPFLIAIVVATNLSGSWLDIPRISKKGKGPSEYRHLFLILGRNETAEIVESEWGAYARTDVVFDERMPDRMNIFTNGTVPAIYPRFDKQAQKHVVPPQSMMDLPFLWGRPERVLSIGPGGGLDIVLAKQAGAREVDGVEVNPSMPVLLDKLRDFGGHPYELPGVHVEIGDGRAFAKQIQRPYDLLIMALTKAGTGNLGSSMVESYLYTEEAVGEYLDALTPRGVVAFITDQKLLGYRFLHTVVSVLEERGRSLSDAMDHIALVGLASARKNAPYSFLVLVSNEPLRKDRCESLQQWVERLRYKAE